MYNKHEWKDMRLWTIQGIVIYEKLLKDGVTYCTKPSWGDEENFMYAYHWMAEQMRKRIGEPPIEGIEYPLWAWYQYDSAKKNKPPRNTNIVPEGHSVYMEIEIPEKDVVLSDFNSWLAPLNQGPVRNWKKIWKKIDLQNKIAGRSLDFMEYPQELRQEIEDSWEAVFDLDLREKGISRTHKRNRSIQATFWALYLENIVSVEFLERKGDIVKPIKYKNRNL